MALNWKIMLKPINTVEEMLHTRQKNPVMTLKLIKDICRRIKKLEAKCKN